MEEWKVKINYQKYIFSKQEWVLYSLEGISIVAGIAYLFYQNLVAFLILLPLLMLFIKEKKEQLCCSRKREVNIQFKDAIQAVSSALHAGYSVENAFIEAGNDMLTLYGKEGIITKEFQLLSGRIKSNETLENILKDFARRSAIDDIQDFTDVFVTAKRSGGDFSMIIKRAVDSIGDKIEVKREIETLMSAKKFEQKIMNVVPFFIILYVKQSSPEFMKALYGNWSGAIVMTVCLVLYLFAYYLSLKIVNIEV